MNKAKHPFFNILMTVICFSFIVTMATSLVIYFRPLYYIMLKVLKVPEVSGYPYEVCRRNYNILIDYNLLWGAKELQFQDFPMSIRGAIHFAEVKQIFCAFQITSWVTLVLVFAGYLYSKKIRAYQWLKWTIVLAVIVVVVVGLAFAIDWDGTFVLMHHILFDNDYWLFDPATDPIIEVLPDEFFLTCGAMILLLMTAGLIICGVVYKKHHRSAPAGKKSGRPAKKG